MIGGSYGGGIQLVSAALDCRIDAIVPVIVLALAGQRACTRTTPQGRVVEHPVRGGQGPVVDPHVTGANESAQPPGGSAEDDEDWFGSRGPANVLDRINVPTLFIQGTVDTLFTLDEA